MAALKAILKSLEGLADPIKELYRKDGEEFRLDVEGMVPKTTLDEFRENNVTLKRDNETLTTKLKTYDGIDVDKIKELQETERKVKDGELIKAGKFDELLTSRLDPIKKEFQTQLDTYKADNLNLSRQLDTMTIDEQLTKLGTAKGLRPTAIEDMLARGRRTFSRKDGKVLAIDAEGAQILTKSGEPMNMQHWIESLSTDAPHLFQSSQGGGTPPGGPKLPPGTKTMVRAEFDKLDATARMTFVTKDGGKVVDA